MTLSSCKLESLQTYLETASSQPQMNGRMNSVWCLLYLVRCFISQTLLTFNTWSHTHLFLWSTHFKIKKLYEALHIFISFMSNSFSLQLKMIHFWFLYWRPPVRWLYRKRGRGRWSIRFRAFRYFWRSGNSPGSDWRCPFPRNKCASRSLVAYMFAIRLFKIDNGVALSWKKQALRSIN